jgi:hypothetical protein
MLEHVADEGELTSNGVIKRGVKQFAHIYDIGGNWGHVITIEKSRSSPTASTLHRRRPKLPAGRLWRRLGLCRGHCNTGWS